MGKRSRKGPGAESRGCSVEGVLAWPTVTPYRAAAALLTLAPELAASRFFLLILPPGPLVSSPQGLSYVCIFFDLLCELSLLKGLGSQELNQD